MKTNASSLKRGEFIFHEGAIWQVVKTEFSFQGRGMAVIRTKIKNVISGKNIDVTFKSVESVEMVDVETREMQFLYADGQQLHFMDPKSYNQLSISQSVVGDVSKFFKEGEKYYVMLHEDTALNIRPPASFQLKITHAEDAARGDTVSNARKQATVETGATVMVPLFIKAGDTISINSETGQYAERVKS